MPAGKLRLILLEGPIAAVSSKFDVLTSFIASPLLLFVQVSAGKLRLILLKGPLGSCVVTGDFDPAKLDETLQHFCGK